jgi:hypothetical protein
VADMVKKAIKVIRNELKKEMRKFDKKVSQARISKISEKNLRTSNDA